MKNRPYIEQIILLLDQHTTLSHIDLKSLKLLTSKDIIEWHFDKTNSEYLNEIKNENTKSVFKRISYIYEYVWYGEFTIDEAAYLKNISDFDKINTLQNG